MKLWPVFFGGFLIAFIAVVLLCQWQWMREKLPPKIIFGLLYFSSWALVACYLVSELSRAGAHFVETGQYYPLDRNPTGVPTLVLGDADQYPDYIFDKGCDRRQPCFKGRISLRVERGANSRPSQISWQTTNVEGGRLAVNGEDATNGQISWSGESYRFPVEWSPSPPTPSARSRRPIRLLVAVELNPEAEFNPLGGSPRITVEHPEPRRVELLDLDATGNDGGRAPGLPQVVYLTSSNQAVALRKTDASSGKDENQSNGGDGKGYIPTIKVSAANINAFLTRPNAPEESADDFILNTGLMRVGYPFGRRVYIGAQSGIIATVVSKGGNWLAAKYVAACLLLWLLPFWFLRSLAGKPRVAALVSVVQMLLAVRFVLSLRAHLFPPHNSEVIEEAVLALLLAPLLICLGCYASDLPGIGRKLQQRQDPEYRRPLWAIWLEFKPVRHWLIALILFPFLFWLLAEQITVPLPDDIVAFSGLPKLLKYEALLAVLLPVIVLLEWWLDQYLRQRNGHDAYIDNRDNPDDPITYLITRRRASGAEEKPLHWRWLLLLLLLFFACLAFGGAVYGLKNYVPQRGLGWVMAGVAASVWTWFLIRVAQRLKTGSRLLAVVLQNLAIVAATVGLLLVVKGVWNLIPWFPRAESASVLPRLLPLRTTIVFEFLILALTVRMLAVFFEGWRDATKVFGWRGFLEVALVFLAPAAMLFVSLLASNDAGAVIVHGPALVGATLVVTGVWSVWKYAAGRRDAAWALALTLMMPLGYYYFTSWRATTFVPLVSEQSTVVHRALLTRGVDKAIEAADAGGLGMLKAIQQHWKMLNYGAEGGLAGRGFGGAPVPGDETFKRITLDDLVFAVYVLAEYGALGGWAVILLYLLLFFLAMRIAWERMRDDEAERWRAAPLRLALLIGALLMLVFPALYMAATNVNQIIFTGQVMPLLGLRSLSDVVRSGLALTLLFACLQPRMARGPVTANADSWWRSIHGGYDLFRQQLRARAGNPEGARRTAPAAIAANLGLIALLLLLFALFPLLGVLWIYGNEDYKKDQTLANLEERAQKFIEDGHIWFEPVPANAQANLAADAKNCQGGGHKNTLAAKRDNPNEESLAYQICTDGNVKGDGEDETFGQLVAKWNGRKEGRGNFFGGKMYDLEQSLFFQLNVAKIPGYVNNKTEMPLTVNPYTYQWRSPFKRASRWQGALTDAAAAEADGGVLVGAGVVLPLRAAKYDPKSRESLYPKLAEIGTVNLDSPAEFPARRGFSININTNKGPQELFKIETVAGVEGALLSPKKGMKDLYLNGCPLYLDDKDRCAEQRNKVGGGVESRTAPVIRLEDRDVIGYAPRDHNGHPVAGHIFVYSQAQLGAFSYLAWVNGERKRHYPQGEAWPLAEQITDQLVSITTNSAASDERNRNVALTVHAELNREVYEMLRVWRACLDGDPPPGSSCQNIQHPLLASQGSRRMSVTLMDSTTGELLVLASDYGTPYNPNDPGQKYSEIAGRPNLNFVRHRVGSAVKPFIAAAALHTFPELRQLTVVDERGDKTKVFGWPLGGKKEILAHSTAVSFDDFLAKSDNLYEITLGLIGLSKKSDESQRLPSFERGSLAANGFRLELRDGGSSLGRPAWADKGTENKISGLERTPMAESLESLFGVRAKSPPQVNSYEYKLWAPLKDLGLLPVRKAILDSVSPEITNFAFADVDDFSKLRSVLLGGSFEDLIVYGEVGSSWSNALLAQSFARMTTGRNVEARIVGGKATRNDFSVWAPNAVWRADLLRGLEGVVTRGTASGALGGAIREISDSVRTGGETRFAVFGKTGTLKLTDRETRDGRKSENDRLDDSTFVFTAGLWNDTTQTFEHSITGAVYFEQGGQGTAQAFAADLLRRLNNHSFWQVSQGVKRK